MPKGRPTRTDKPEKTTIHLSRKTKQKLFALACSTSMPMGKVIEGLIEAAGEPVDEAGGTER